MAYHNFFRLGVMLAEAPRTHDEHIDAGIVIMIELVLFRLGMLGRLRNALLHR